MTRPEASLAEWRDAVEMHWTSDGISQGTAEEEWQVFNARAERAMTRAHEQWAPCPRPPAATQRIHACVCAAVRQRLLSRLTEVRELRRQLAQGRNPVSLRQALARRWPAHIARDIPWARVQQLAEEWLNQSFQQEAADRLRVWRHEIIKCRSKRFANQPIHILRRVLLRMRLPVVEVGHLVQSIRGKVGRLWPASQTWRWGFWAAFWAVDFSSSALSYSGLSLGWWLSLCFGHVAFRRPAYVLLSSLGL